MEDVFERIGFSSPEAGVGLLFILVIILFVICIALIIGMITLLVRKRDFSRNIAGISTKGRRVQKTKGAGQVSNEKVEVLATKQKRLTKNIDDIYRKLSKTYQKVGIVKYNAYSNMSGNVSFVIAMLDETDSGFVLNVINGKEGSNTYIKDITEGESNERLGEEEAQALLLAVSSDSEN